MKKEISIQLQFALMVLLTSGAYLVLVWGQGTSQEMIGEVRLLLLGWLVAFLVLCGIRLTYVGLFKAVRVQSNSRTTSSDRQVTLTYGIIGSLSVLFAWPAYISQLLFRLPSHMSVNLLELWLNFRQTILALFVGFGILVLVRLAVVRFSRIDKFG